MAGLEEVPVLVKDVTDEQAAALALIENLQREDLDPIEVAEGCRRLIDQYGLTQEQAAQRLGKSRSALTNTLRLLGLPGRRARTGAHRGHQHRPRQSDFGPAQRANDARRGPNRSRPKRSTCARPRRCAAA